MQETWKDIEGFAPYQVSNLGRVRNADYWGTKKIRMLTPTPQTSGYLSVTMRHDGKRYSRTVHRLVAQAFVPNPDNKPCVNHRNECKLDNRAENLEWMTSAENNRYGTHIERAKKNRWK